MISLWQLPRLPFIYSHLESPSNPCGLPDQLPFELGIDPLTGRVTQVGCVEVRAALEKAYREGSRISGQMDGEGPGRQYADDLLKALPSLLGRESFAGLRVLEVGCGTGYLLSRLREMGAVVLGIEPGEHRPLQDASFDVEIIRDFFPSDRVKGLFDLVLTSMVLEHFEDPEAFVREMMKCLSPGGAICCTVPDCETFLQQGDPSMLFHEHYSYFTHTSLHNTLARAGLGSVKIQKSTFTNILHSAAKRAEGQGALLDVDAELEIARSFPARATALADKIHAFLRAQASSRRTVGIYVPGRYANIHSMTRQPVEGLRFFDDNPSLLGTYFPGISIPVENFDALQRKPVDVVLIMSLSFGARIKVRLQSSLPPSVEIVTLAELCALG